MSSDHVFGLLGSANLSGGECANGTPRNWSTIALEDGMETRVPTIGPESIVTVGDMNPSGSLSPVVLDDHTEATKQLAGNATSRTENLGSQPRSML